MGQGYLVILLEVVVAMVNVLITIYFKKHDNMQEREEEMMQHDFWTFKCCDCVPIMVYTVQTLQTKLVYCNSHLQCL